MTTLDDVTKKKAEQSAEAQATVELVRLAQLQGQRALERTEGRGGGRAVLRTRPDRPVEYR
jgi:hypothetical protein